MKKEFLDFLNAMIAAAPDVANEMMTDNVKAYIVSLEKTIEEKPDLTDSGKEILQYLQSVDVMPYKAKDIAEGLFVSSRRVSGSLRKLVSDGFCEKVGQDPVLYTITEKGKNYIID